MRLTSIGCSLGCLLTAGSAHAVQGGDYDSTIAHSVVIATGGPASPVMRCSGTLISPNVVLTARHCISRLPDTGANCQKIFGEPTATPRELWVDAAPRIGPSTTWKNVASWELPSDASLCGNDIALLVLATPFERSEAVPARVVTTEAELLAIARRRSFGVAGFGASSGRGMDIGARRSRFGIPLACLPGEPGFACDGALAYLDPSELSGGAGPCSGDSGAAAIVETDRGAIFGVLSRGDTDAETCTQGIFERTDAWRWLIAGVVLRAAPERSRAPAWASEAFPEAPRTGELCVASAACGDGSDCVSLDRGRSFVCARRCEAGCGAGQECESNVCVDAPASAGGGNAGCSVVRVSGASTAGAPSAALLALAAALVAGTGLGLLRIFPVELATLARIGRLGWRRRKRR